MVFDEFSSVFNQVSEWRSDDGRLVIQNTATCQFKGPFCDDQQAKQSEGWNWITKALMHAQ